MKTAWVPGVPASGADKRPVPVEAVEKEVTAIFVVSHLPFVLGPSPWTRPASQQSQCLLGDWVPLYLQRP